MMVRSGEIVIYFTHKTNQYSKQIVRILIGADFCEHCPEPVRYTAVSKTFFSIYCLTNEQYKNFMRLTIFNLDLIGGREKDKIQIRIVLK